MLGPIPNSHGAGGIQDGVLNQERVALFINRIGADRYLVRHYLTLLDCRLDHDYIVDQRIGNKLIIQDSINRLIRMEDGDDRGVGV